MDAAPYDNVEFPPIRRPLGTPATWPGSDHVIMSIKSPTPKTVKPKTESKLSPVLEGDGSEFIEEQAELPSVQDQRQVAQVTNLRDKKETEITVNKGVTLVNSNQVGRPPSTLKTINSPSSSASTSETHTLVPFGAKTTIATTTTATTTPTSVIPSTAMDSNGKIGFVIVEEPRPFNQDFSRLDLNPPSQQVLARAYTKQRKFYKLNDCLLTQGEDMRQDVWQAKGRPGELLTYEQLLQGMLEEGEVLVLGGAWLYFTHLDFMDKECKAKVKPSIGKGRICLTDQKLLILSAEANEDATLSEFGDASPGSQGGYKLELSKFNSTFYQNVPLGCFLGVELSASVGSSLESRLTEQTPLCGGLCSCLGMASKTLKELLSCKDKQTPYPNCSLRVCVLKVGFTATFPGSDGKECQILNFSVGDTTEAAMASLNDQSKFPTIKEGKNLLLRNFVLRGGKVILTKNSKIMGSQAVEVPEHIRERGIFLICPPSPTKPIKEVGNLPKRQLVTVQGQVVKDEAIRIVKVGMNETPIHTIRLMDSNAEINVSLWRELSKAPVRIGQFIQISQCLTGEWDGKPQLNSTRNTIITEIQVPEMTCFGDVEGISLGELSSELAINCDGEYKDLNITNSDLFNALNLEEQELEASEEAIINLLPIKASFRVKGCDVTKMTVEENETTRSS